MASRAHPLQNEPRLFVAHPFTERGRDVVDNVVVPAARTHGLACDLFATRDDADIAAEVQAHIRRCAALVAVTIDRNPNVFFEIGVAAALGKPCALLADVEGDFAMLVKSLPCISASDREAAVKNLSVWIATWRRPASVAT
jgi:nucleoside 2-deoxyribosyltransferase